MSHGRADTYAVALRVERTVACAAGHDSASSPCAVAIVAARAAEHVNALAGIHAQTRPTHTCARNVSQAHTSSFSKSNALCRGLPLVAHAAERAHSYVRGGATAAARAASHENALTAIRAGTRTTRALVRDVSRASLARRTSSDAHMLCPLSAGCVSARTDTLSHERVDTCVAALNVERARSPLAAHAAGIAQSSVCADARLLHARTTRALARDISRACRHIRCRSRVKRTVACAGRLPFSLAVASETDCPSRSRSHE